MNQNVLDLGGWEYRPETIDRIVGAAEKPRFWEAKPELKGYHKGKTVLQHLAFDKVLGKSPFYRNQTRGTCVGRGGARVGDLCQAMQDLNGEGKFQALVAACGIYGGARVEIGRGVHGNRIGGDGAVVAYAVECMTQIGSALCEVYEAGGKTWDLRKASDDDDLAVQWGQSGIPDALEPLIKRYCYRDWWPVYDGLEAMDGMASGRAFIFGTDLAHWGRSLPAKRDANGFLPLVGTTAHCWIGTGSIDDGQITGGVLDNRSWTDWVTGPEGKYPLGDGRYLCDPGDITRMITGKHGEGYLVDTFQGLLPKPGVLDWIML